MEVCSVCGRGVAERVLVLPSGYCRDHEPQELRDGRRSLQVALEAQDRAAKAARLEQQAQADATFRLSHRARLWAPYLTVEYDRPGWGWVKVGEWKLGRVLDGGESEDANRPTYASVWQPTMPTPCRLELALEMAKGGRKS